jgi:aspartate aminotransferase-like enzyme
MYKKLFTPGPIEVIPEILKTMATPMISHRGKEYHQLHARVREKLRQLLYVREGYVFLVTSSSTGAMEGAIRNLVNKKVLHATCGAFGERWYEISRANGKQAELLAVEWGKGIHPEMLEERLKKGGFDTFALVHSETSTGVMNPLEEISKVMRRFPEVFWIVDAVSSMAAAKIEPERLGIDLVLAGVQKGFSLPPGLTVLYCSQRAMSRAQNISDRGYYFDLVEFKAFDDKDETPTTPSISHIYALDHQLDRILSKGLETHFARTLELAQTCRSWATERFALFPEKGFEAIGLTCVTNTRNISVKGLNEELGKRGATISGGYGKLKEKTFRIAHMGDITLSDLRQLLGWIDEILRL